MIVRGERGIGMDKIGKGDEEVQISSYKMNKSRTCTVEGIK